MRNSQFGLSSNLALYKSHAIAFLIGALLVNGAAVALAAWTAPTAQPPQNNDGGVINTGTANQIKDGGLGVDSMAVYGDVLIEGVAQYLNMGTDEGEVGYGMRNDNGTMQFKHAGGGGWASFPVCDTVGQEPVWTGSDWGCQ